MNENNFKAGKISTDRQITGHGIVVNGLDGVGIEKIEKTASAGLVDTYTIYYTNKKTKTFTITNGANGINGKSLDFSWQGTKLGIKIEGQEEYTYIDLKGDKGNQGAKGEQGDKGEKGDKGEQGEQGIQGDKGEKGKDGNGIKDIILTDGNHLAGSMDTYTIYFTDGSTTEFKVYNGQDFSDEEKEKIETDIKELKKYMPMRKDIILIADNWIFNEGTNLYENKIIDENITEDHFLDCELMNKEDKKIMNDAEANTFNGYFIISNSKKPAGDINMQIVSIKTKEMN